MGAETERFDGVLTNGAINGFEDLSNVEWQYIWFFECSRRRNNASG
jgi:hypothetical protein